MLLCILPFNDINKLLSVRYCAAQQIKHVITKIGVYFEIKSDTVSHLKKLLILE